MRPAMLLTALCSLLLGVFVYRQATFTPDPYACSPVKGVVTLDGEPLANAFVTFHPQSKNRPSLAITDIDGHYELSYSSSKEGALLGVHDVTIMTSSAEDVVNYNKEVVPARFRKIPSTLRFVVEKKENVFNIQLTTTSEDVAELEHYNKIHPIFYGDEYLDGDEPDIFSVIDNSKLPKDLSALSVYTPPTESVIENKASEKKIQ
jgi:hypothetical protein